MVPLEEDIDAVPDWLKEEVSSKTLKFSDMTNSLIIDVGIYFGVMFLNEISTLEWGLVHKPKNYAYVNRPIITGFKKKAGLNPFTVVSNCSLREVKQGANENRLFDQFNTLKEYL